VGCQHPLHVGPDQAGIGFGVEAHPDVGGNGSISLGFDVGIGDAGERPQLISQGVDRHAGLPSATVPGSVIAS
jgi:hypothetical protein